MAEKLAKWDGACERALDWLGAHRIAGALMLLFLALACYLPGVINLPPVDRTEVIYAESSRQMLSEGRWIDPRYAGERERHRPIGTFWLQAASAKMLGPAAAQQISTYRLPSLAGVLLAVLATYWMLVPVIGGRQAFLAGGLVAVTPIAALQANLAITEGITFGPATVAQLALLRIYLAREGERATGLALSFWLAQGVGILLNAFAVPILSLATLVALWIIDRRLAWLSRLHPWWGLPLAALIGSPWLVELYAVTGGKMYAGMSWREFLGALGGSQAMKFHAPPLSFTLGFVLGMLPVTLLLWPALRNLWARQTGALPRFLFAWIAGYLGYLELISAKPALYTVQALFPPAAAAVALLLACDGDRAPLRLPERLIAWPGLIFAALVPVLYVVMHRLMLVPLGGPSIASAAIVAALLGLGTAAMMARRAALWLTMTLAAFAAFLGLTFGGLLPRLETAWTSDLIAKAVAPLQSCLPGPVAIVGSAEPSTVFTFGAGNVHLDAGQLPANMPPLVVVHAKQDAAFRSRAPKSTPLACVETVNFTRGCLERFTAYTTKDAAACRPEPRFACGPDRKSATLQGKLCP